MYDWKKDEREQQHLLTIPINHIFLRARQSIKKGIKIACCCLVFFPLLTLCEQQNMVHLSVADIEEWHGIRNPHSRCCMFSSLLWYHEKGCLWTIIIIFPFVAISKYNCNHHYLSFINIFVYLSVCYIKREIF